MALAAEPDALAVMDSGRDLDRERPLLDDPARAAALGARLLDPAARAGARRAGLRADELAEDAARHLLQPSGSAAGRAGRDLAAGLRAVPAAARAGHSRLERHLARDAVRRLDEVDLDRRGEVGAARAAAARGRRRGRRRRRRPRRDRRGCRSRRARPGSRRCAARRGRSGRRGRASRVFDSTSYASTTSRNRSCASGASETSGWSSRASCRKARLISASLASRPTPSSS